MDFSNKEQRLSFCKNKLIPLVTRIVNKSVRNPQHVDKKGQGNFVTEIEIELENKLMHELSILCPVSGFITEEGGINAKEELNWIIDPIDGTTNFINSLLIAE